MEAQRRHLAGDRHSAVDVPVTPRSASPSALTSVFSGVGPGQPPETGMQTAQETVRGEFGVAVASIARGVAA